MYFCCPISEVWENVLFEEKVSIFTHVCVSTPWWNVDNKYSFNNTVEGTHPDGKDVIIEGVTLSYCFACTLVVFTFVPLLGWPSLFAIACGSPMHCSYAWPSVPVLLANATRFFQHSICSFLSLSISDTFFCLDFLSVNVSKRFCRFGRWGWTKCSTWLLFQTPFIPHTWSS